MLVSDRGVSDLVGFVLMFSVIIASVAIIGTAGITQLSDLSERESIDSSVSSMSKFASTVGALNRQGDLYRTAALSPGGGTIWVNDSVSIRVAVPSASVDETIDVDALEHRFGSAAGDPSVVYEAGAVFRTDGALARYRPTMRCRPNDRAVVSLVNLSATDSISQSGGASGPGALQPGEFPDDVTIITTESSIELTARLRDTEVVYKARNGGPADLTIDVGETIDPEQWQFHFEGSGWTRLNPASNPHEYTCEDVQTVLVRTVDVELSA